MQLTPQQASGLRVRQAYQLWLVLVILISLVASSFLTTSAANLAQSPLVGPGTGPSGTLTGCLGTSDTAASLRLGGRPITPSTLLRVAPTGACDPTEQNLNLFSYASTVLVSAGPDPVVNGSNLLSTLSAVAVLSPSATKPFLLKLEPGVFDLGNNRLTMVPFVQVEGSGEKATKISAAGQTSGLIGVIKGASNSELRYLTVESRSGDSYSTGIYIAGSNSDFSVSHVTVQVDGGSAYSIGILNDTSTSALIDEVTIIVSNTTTTGRAYGVYNNSSSNAQIQNSRVQVATTGGTSATDTGKAYGFYNYNASPLIKNDIVNVSSSGNPAGSNNPEAVGIADFAGGTHSLVQETNVTVLTSGGGIATGLRSDASSVSTFQNVRVKVITSGGGDGVGIYLNNQANVTVEDSNIAVSTDGANFAQGALNNTSNINLTIRNTTLIGSATNKAGCQAFGINTFGGLVNAYATNINTTIGTGCSAAYGLLLQGTPNVINFNHGFVKSGNYAIFNSTVNKVMVGASQLDAPSILFSSSPALCIGSFKGDYSATNANCS